MARTKIVCTIGPATQSPEMVRALIDAGMRVARVNNSHGTAEEHAETVRLVRKASAVLEVPVAILFDLSGPKIRTGALAEPVPLLAGQEFVLTSRAQPAPGEVPLGFPNLPRYVQPGQRLLLDDGSLEAEVRSVTDTDIVCRALNAGPLGSHKGINLPGASLPIPAVTDKDVEDVRHGLQLGVDWIAMSFVRTAEDILPIKAIMAEVGISRPIIAKIEKHEAIASLDGIVDAYDGIMVARGDLGVEVSLELIPLLQKEIIRKANAAGKPVITATQMLDSMIRNPRPTRAEVTDVANAILDGTDAVMLSGETATGKYPVEAVRTMAAVAGNAETLLPDAGTPQEDIPLHHTPDGALAAAAVKIAANLGAGAIVAATERGYTATLVSKSRPKQPIVALTARPETFTQLPLLWGVTPLLVPDDGTPDDRLDRAVRAAVRRQIVADGDLLIIVSVTSQPVGVVTRASNVLRIANVRQRGE